MADNKTEKATPKRREKARTEGRVPRSREMSSSAALMGVICLLHWYRPGWIEQWHALTASLLDAASKGDINLNSAVIGWTGMMAVRWIAPAWALALGIAVAAQFAQGGFVFVPTTLIPKFPKLNPVTNLKGLVSLGGLTRLLKALVPLFVIFYVTILIFSAQWSSIIHSSTAGISALPMLLISNAWEIMWKSAFVFALWAVVDYVLMKRSFENGMKMSKQDIRQEGREAENPDVKGRQKGLRRAMRKKRMMKDVERATVVITNPTHFAVALRYDMEESSAPIVVAKGRDLIAQQIRKIAVWNGIPMVENPPLARALYRSADVGTIIPSKLYVAVAEILAFVYRAQAEAARRNGGRA
jgi:flagellar biosynthetic protein FlhB